MSYPLAAQLTMQIPASGNGLTLQPSVSLPADTAGAGMEVPYIATVPLAIASGAMGGNPGEQGEIQSVSIQMGLQMNFCGQPSSNAVSVSASLNSPFGTIAAIQLDPIYFNNTITGEGSPYWVFQGFESLPTPAPFNLSETNNVLVTASLGFPVSQVPSTNAPGTFTPQIYIPSTIPQPDTGQSAPSGNYVILSGTVYQAGEPR